jgi:uncharacterized protein (DUF2236 family)
MRLAHLVLDRFPGGLPVARWPMHIAMRSIFGPPPIDPDRDPGDPGLFGPASASWVVLGSPPGIVGGIRALMMQLLHPGAMAGVADHSRYEDDPLERLRATARYVATVAFGSLPEVFAVTRDVRRAHTFVRGTRPDGLPYSAEDPHLLAWVSIALTDSFLAAYRAYGTGPLDDGTADAFVAEQSRAAALLDPRVNLDEVGQTAMLDLPMLAEGTLPQNQRDLTCALDRYMPELRLNEQSSKTLRFMLWPSIPAPVRAGYLPLMAGAVATLPAEIRDLLNMPHLGPADAAIRSQTRLALTTMRLLAGRSGALEVAMHRIAAKG